MYMYIILHYAYMLLSLLSQAVSSFPYASVLHVKAGHPVQIYISVVPFLLNVCVHARVVF